MSGEECFLHLPRWMFYRGGVLTKKLCVNNVPDIVQGEDSGGPRSVASWSYYEGDQYLTCYVSL